MWSQVLDLDTHYEKSFRVPHDENGDLKAPEPVYTKSDAGMYPHTGNDEAVRVRAFGAVPLLGPLAELALGTISVLKVVHDLLLHRPEATQLKDTARAFRIFASGARGALAQAFAVPTFGATYAADLVWRMAASAIDRYQDKLEQP